MSLSIIVAIGKDYAIGQNKQLLCRLSDDLKRFRKITSGHTIIMGRKTFESLPNGPLPNRRNIVISRTLSPQKGIEIARNVDEALSMCDPNKKNYLIGGGELYKQMLPLCKELHLTLIDEVFPYADTHFPTLNMKEWQVLEFAHIDADDKNDFSSEYYHLIRE